MTNTNIYTNAIKAVFGAATLGFLAGYATSTLIETSSELSKDQRYWLMVHDTSDTTDNRPVIELIDRSNMNEVLYLNDNEGREVIKSSDLEKVLGNVEIVRMK